MCLILVAWQVRPDYPLIVAANRDEFFARPTRAARFWPDAPDVFAGRDLEAGGSWLGISRSGRFAALTNYRQGGKPDGDAPSRGALVTNFLVGEADASDYGAALTSRAELYRGFNLLVSDGRQLAYCSNRGAGSFCLAPGIYGLSNHLLDTPWPKLSAAKSAFSAALGGLPADEPFFELLADREIVADPNLPDTGVGREWERILSAVFVASPHYGTRASTLLTVHRSGGVRFIERSFGPAGAPLGDVSTSFTTQVSPIRTGV